MTVPASPDVRARFNCTGGVEYDLPAGLIFFDDTDLDVYRIDADGVSALLDHVTDYSVDGGDGGTGSVTTVNTFSDGELLVVVNVPAEQGYDMIQGDGFLPDQLERQLDRQTILQQQLVENLQRILYLPVTTEESFNPGLPAPIAGHGIRINDAGDGFVLFPAGPDGGYAVSDTPASGKVATWDGMPLVDARVFGLKVDNDQGDAAINLSALIDADAFALTLPGGGGTIILPSGKIWINDTFTLSNGNSLVGQGNKWFGATQLSITDNTKEVIILKGQNYIGRIAVGTINASGATKAAVKLDAGEHNLLEHIHIRQAGIGLEIYNSIWNTFNHVDVQGCADGLKLYGDTGANQYSNNNTFTGCKFRINTGKGAIINRGRGNVFVGCNFENNTGIGLEIDGLFAGAFIPSFQINSVTGGSSFIGCWFEANGAGGEPVIKVRDDQNTEFINCVIFNTVEKTTAMIDIDSARKINFSGAMSDFASVKKFFYIGPTAVFTDISKVDSYGLSSVVDYGIGTIYTGSKRLKGVERTLANQSFNVLGGGGADVFGSWTESNNTAGTGTITADNSKLIRPQSHSQYSCKFVLEANPASIMGILQSGTLLTGTQYYAVVEYENGTPDKINSPLEISIYDNTSKFWDFVNREWSLTSKFLKLPISTRPTSIAVPFITDSVLTSYRLQVRNSASGTNAANVVHWIYSANFQIGEVPNPASDWTAAPSANAWNVGDRIINTVPTAGQPKAWSCTVSGTPGTWVSEGNL